MLFAKALAVGASFVVAALAQSKIQFTTFPTAVKAGVPIDLKWINGNDSVRTVIWIVFYDSHKLLILTSGSRLLSP